MSRQDKLFTGRSTITDYKVSPELEDIKNPGTSTESKVKAAGDTLPKLSNAIEDSVPQLLIAPNMEGGLGSNNNPITQGYNVENFLADKKIGKFSGMPAATNLGGAFDSGYEGFTPALDLLQSVPANARSFINNSTLNTSRVTTTGENVLHNYEPYNYIIQLSVLGKDAYNADNFENDPGIIIAQTGGKGKKNQREGVLGVDYYIERLNFKNVIQSTPDSPTTNAFSITMSISEPLGVDLISAMVSAAQQQGYDNHMMAVYLLSIKFVGYDDNGNPQEIPIPGGARYIPCRLYNVQLDVEAGGSSYSIEASPYTYTPKSASYDQIPYAVICRGNTVRDILESFFENHNRQLQKASELNTIGIPNTYDLDIEGSEQELLESNMNTTDSLKTTASQQVNISINEAEEVKETERKIVVEKGQSILKFIRFVLDNSEFMLNRVEPNQEIPTTDVPIPNIMTDADIIAENNEQGDQAYAFRYALRTQIVDGSSTPRRVQPHRRYNYIYTGENKDILDFQLRYKFAYFEPTFALPETGDSTPEDDPVLEQGQSRHSRMSTAFNQKKQDKGVPTTITPHGGGADFGTMPASTITGNQSNDILPDADQTNKEAIDKMKMIFEDPAADMIVCTLDILGDPGWIEQKTVRKGSRQQSQAGPYIESDGSISTDGRAQIIEINAKLPTDIDDNTGLYKLDNTAFFQGTFQAYMCESNFEGGVFTQTLDLIRQKNQPRDSQQGGIAPKISTAGTLGSGSFFDSDLGKGSYGSVNSLIGSTSNVTNQGKSAFSRPTRQIKKYVSNQGKPIKTKSGWLTRGKNPILFPRGNR